MLSWVFVLYVIYTTSAEDAASRLWWNWKFSKHVILVGSKWIVESTSSILELMLTGADRSIYRISDNWAKSNVDDG